MIFIQRIRKVVKQLISRNEKERNILLLDTMNLASNFKIPSLFMTTHFPFPLYPLLHILCGLCYPQLLPPVKFVIWLQLPCPFADLFSS